MKINLEMFFINCCLKVPLYTFSCSRPNFNSNLCFQYSSSLINEKCTRNSESVYSSYLTQSDGKSMSMGSSYLCSRSMGSSLCSSCTNSRFVSLEYLHKPRSFARVFNWKTVFISMIYVTNS